MFRSGTAWILLLPVMASAAKSELPARSVTTADSGVYFIGVRVLKTQAAGKLNWAADLPPTCANCQLLLNPVCAGQNVKEFYFHFLAPNAPDVIKGVRVKVNPTQVRTVLVGKSHVAFTRSKDAILFDVPRNGPTMANLATFRSIPGDGPGDVTEMYSYLEAPAVELRVEHADEQRRNGPYAKRPWPALERQAALNLEFAAREAIIALGLDITVRENALGTILLMGFDTNFPTLNPTEAHPDDPPHWHMHMSWAHAPLIREVGHFYIGTDGLLINNVVGSALTDKSDTYERGRTYETRTNAGELLYSQIVTPEGHFTLTTADGSCRFTPAGIGFHAGVDVNCSNGKALRRIRVEDTVDEGRLRLYIDDRLTEEHRYDQDNGALQRSEINYDRP